MRPHLLLTGALASLTLAGVSGCVAPPDDRPDAEAATSTATALVVVERTTGPGDTMRGDAVIARFVRVRQGSVDDQALRLAGAAWDLPAPGTCSAAAQDSAQPALQPRSVDLLDVGVLSVDRDGTRSTVLLPRSMPDPTGVVSGVFYSARSAEAFTPSARLQLHTSGGPDMPEGFRVDVASPHELSDVRVSPSSSSENGRNGLDVAWDADALGADARDLVYVDVLGPASRLVARCTVGAAAAESGQLTIPAASLGAIDEGQLSVHHLHRESFRAKGIEPGEIRFDLARVVAFHR